MNIRRLLSLFLMLVFVGMPCLPCAAQETRVFVDSVGREVEVPVQIDRIAPSGKMAHIVLYALSPEKFVCLSNPWTRQAEQYFDPQFLNLPVVGQFYGESALNREALAAAAPQVIIDLGQRKKSMAGDMDTIQTQLGIPAVFIEADMAHMDHCYEMLGDLLGEQEAARTLSDYCNRIYTNTEQTMAAIGAENRIRLLYCLGEDGQSVIAKGSYHAEVLDMLCNNLAVVEKPSSNAFGNPVDFEQLYQWDPDVILFAPDSVYARAGDDPLWQQMKAIAGETYYEVPSGPFNWMGFPPSVNRYMGMIWLSELLYPEMFSYDLLEETRQYYQLFYHIDLTRDTYERLTEHALPTGKS